MAYSSNGVGSQSQFGMVDKLGTLRSHVRKRTHRERERERGMELHPLHKMGNKIVAVSCKIPRLDLPHFKDIPNLSAL